ncbi:tail fiber assembly protein [Siccibacter colletis]|uniref:Tail fiber assembly protein n=1 Tax=Siccibacter colletis TaxID=1505757 RepID=A0ABY6JF79_9ENTR|nr:tail fiber assembly protein [Siccibacter colletis]UYU31113.1 tail fiber assembly protein [Siccibacter colletis]
MNEALPGVHNLDGCTQIENDAHPFKLSDAPSGKYWCNGEGNHPVLIDIPPPTREETIKGAALEIQNKINAANDFINQNQWPSLLAFGRLSEKGKTEFNQWLDYLDALKRIDVSGAPDILWPTPPAEPAS